MMSICKIEDAHIGLNLFAYAVYKFEIIMNKIQLVYIRGWRMLGIIL